MLFDLLRAEGDWQEFEALSLRFRESVGRTAPAWISHEDAAHLPPELRPGGSAYFELAGALDMRLAPQLEALRDHADGHTTLHLDLSKVSAVEADACLQLSDVLRYLAASHNGALLTGTERLTLLLRHAAEGNGGTPGYWLLLLDLYQLRGLRAEFERTALEYALATGCSPPEWQPVLMPVISSGDVEEKRGEPRYQSGPEVIALHGVLVGASDPQLARLRAFAQGREYINVNLARVTRVDSGCATALAELGNELARAGKTVRLIRPNALVATLLSTFDLDPKVQVSRPSGA
jgi:ABC-type transporter Mla MlaB component